MLFIALRLKARLQQKRCLSNGVCGTQGATKLVSQYLMINLVLNVW